MERVICAIRLLEQNPDKIKWWEISRNPNAIHLLEQNLDKINWRGLSCNPNAIRLLEQNQNKIIWIRLSMNPNAIHLLEQNPDKINWSMLSQNPNAIHLLEQYNKGRDDTIGFRNKISSWLFINISIFEIDYNKLKKLIEPFKEELIKTCLHPKRLVYYLDKYNYDIGEDIFIDW